MWRRPFLLVLLVGASCYSPELRECVAPCSSAADCLAPHICGSDGLCATSDVAGRCASITTDAADRDGPIDAPIGNPDAPTSTVCVQATCSAAGGTCEQGWCVIDSDSNGEVTCPAGMPCTVICDEQDKCKNGVKCGLATSCVVRCTADAACQDRGVDCGSAATCNVTCTGSSACQHGSNGNRSVECRASACEVTCSGSGACQDGIDVDTGTCESHCCGDACEGGTDTCINDNVCS